jgi:cell division septation protein DedD
MTDSKRLTHLFRSLSETRQQALVEYAEFLASREAVETLTVIPTEPLPIPRPPQENVVKAIQRLRQTYPMLDSAKVFNEASAQMTRHLMHGIDAVEVIDELERIFLRHYQATIDDSTGQS